MAAKKKVARRKGKDRIVFGARAGGDRNGWTSLYDVHGRKDDEVRMFLFGAWLPCTYSAEALRSLEQGTFQTFQLARHTAVVRRYAIAENCAPLAPTPFPNSNPTRTAMVLGFVEHTATWQLTGAETSHFTFEQFCIGRDNSGKIVSYEDITRAGFSREVAALRRFRTSANEWNAMDDYDVTVFEDPAEDFGVMMAAFNNIEETKRKAREEAEERRRNAPLRDLDTDTFASRFAAWAAEGAEDD